MTRHLVTTVVLTTDQAPPDRRFRRWGIARPEEAWTAVQFDELRAEYRSVGIGPLILDEVRGLVRSVVRGYDPVVYGHVWRWDEAIDDVVQEFCVEVLIEQGQLDYAMLLASDHTHFRRLLARQIRFLLARRRRRTVIDNLLGRCRQMASSPPFRVVSGGTSWSYTLEQKRVVTGISSAAVLKTVVDRASSVRITRSNPAERAPAIYSEESLRELMAGVADGMETAVTVADLDRILSSLLTSWLPRFLDDGGALQRGVYAQSVSAEEAAIADELAEQMAVTCSDVQRSVLRLKLDGASDREIVRQLGISRPTVAKRRREVTGMLVEHLSGLSELACARVMERLSALLKEGNVEL